MSELAARLETLSPEKRELLRRELARRRHQGAPRGADEPERRPGAVGDYPLSWAQERLWFLERLEGAAGLYAMPGAFRLRGELVSGCLDRAFAEIVRRHATLRTTFPEQEGEPVQRVAPPGPVPRSPVVDLTGLPEERRERCLRALLRRESRRPFDLAAGPLVRRFLAPLAPRERVLFLNLHHVISDGWSMGVMVRELAALHDAFSRNLPSPLPELPLQYAEHAARERRRLAGGMLEARIEHWRRVLEGAPAAVELPWDRPRPPVRSARGGQRPVRLDPAAAERLRDLAREGGASPFMALLATLAAYLSRTGGAGDLVVGTPIANRDRRETEGMIGLLLNTLALRIDLTGEPSFRELLARVRRSTLDGFAHAELPFERLVEELAPERSLEHTPLFQVMLVLQGRVEEPGGRAPLGGSLTIERLEMEPGSAKFDLLLDLSESGDGFAGALEYSADLFDPTTADRLARGWALLAGAAAEAPDLPVAALPLLAPAQRHQLLHEWGPGGALPATEALTIHGLFRVQVGRTPDAPAVAGGPTYRELAVRAATVARRLQALGVGPEVLVGVCLDRGPDLPAALLGVLETGAAYLPLDPAYPEERIAYMLRDAGAPVVVTRDSLADRLPDGARRVLLEELDAEEEPPAPELPEPPGPGVPPEALAYAIYTSGSTGEPKGVAITHRSAVAMLAWARGAFPEAAAGPVLASTSICFDLSVFELFLPLTTGGSVALAEDALALPETAEAHPVRLLNTVPSAMAELVRLGALPPSVETVNLAGEALSRELVEAVYCAGGAGRVRRVVNLYGPSEDTTYSTVATMEPGGRDAPAIGRPVAGSRAYVLDPRGRPVAAGARGELTLAGSGLARGYLGRPAATAERFVPDPFAAEAGEPGARAYRTGDLARHRGGGELDFLGRIDAQVKLRGYRIEPGEVAAALASHPAVREAAVVVREDRPGDPRLVAYAVPEEGGAAPRTAELRTFLARSLPDAMIPGVVVVLEGLPRTPNGKVDRRALTGPEHAPAARGAPGDALALSGALSGPRSGTEELLAEIWREVLGVGAVAAGDDFFALGGHSLLATRLVSRVRRALGVELPLRAAFRHPTLRSQAAAVDRLRGEAPAAPPIRPVGLPGERPARFPLSFAQERLWFLDQLEPASAAYHLPTALRLRGPLSVPSLVTAAAGLVRRHEVLRTTFTGGPDGSGEPVQVVGQVPDPADLVPVIDLSGLPERAAGEEARRRAGEEARRPFDLARGPLVRIRLLRAAPEDHHLVLVVHHAVSDGWSTGVMVGELAALYEARLRGVAAGLPELPVQYGDFAAWQRAWLAGEVLERLLAAWRERLGPGPHVLELPTDRPRPPVQTFRGARVTRRLPAGLAGRLRELARRRGATPFMAALALFQALLARYTGERAISVGSPIAGRNREEIEPLVGFFVNTLVLRTELPEGAGPGELLEIVREVTLDAYARQDLPFEKLVEELAPVRSLAHPPLFQVLFVYQNAPVPRLDLPGIEVSAPFDPGTGATKLDLTLEVQEEPHRTGAGQGGLVLALEHNTDLFDRTTAVRLLGHYEVLVRAAAAEPGGADRPVADLPLLLPGERHQALHEWNDTAAAPETPTARDGGHTLVERIGARIAATPDAPAVASPVAGPLTGSERLTYGELGDWAGRLAAHLREAGVGPETPVGIALGRSADLPVVLLAVLAAGGAYVPLDPAYPAERLELMLEDSGARLVLTEEGAAERLPAGVATVRLDAEREAIRSRPPARLRGPAHSDSLAWVIYTSGSTGRPKGVAIRHRSAAALLSWAAEVFPEAGAGAVLASTSLSFDLSTFEIFLPLATGGTVVVAPSAVHLPEVAAAHPVRLVNTVPSAMAEVVRAGSLPPEVETVNLAGEPLARELVEAIYRAGRVRRVLNLYGPSEDTTYSTFATVAPGSAASAPTIGRPVGEARAHLVDAAGRPVPRGVPGELLLGGAGVARGYLGRPAATAERFVPDGFAPVGGGPPGARLYRTGDLARHRGDGELEFLGRLDHQVKLRGFRIELGEVEAVLRQHPAVADAAAAVRQGSGAEDRRLVAYAVPADGAAPLDAGELAAWLSGKLPAYMVPSALVELEALPLTPNGKLDRRALPDPETWGTGAASEHVPPRTETERAVAAVWQEVLGLGGVGVHDNFFDLGGHSLLMVRAYHRLKASLGRELPLIATFAHPTVAALAAHLDGAGDADAARRGGEARGERRRAAALAARQERAARRRGREEDHE